MKNTGKRFFGFGFARGMKLLIVMLAMLASLFGGTSFLLSGLNSFSSSQQSSEYEEGSVQTNPNGIDDKVSAASPSKIGSYGYTLDPNGGTVNGSSNVQTFTYSSPYTRYLPTPTRSGYTFDRWAMEFDGNNTATLASEYKYPHSSFMININVYCEDWSSLNGNIISAGTGDVEVRGSGEMDYVKGGYSFSGTGNGYGYFDLCFVNPEGYNVSRHFLVKFKDLEPGWNWFCFKIVGEGDECYVAVYGPNGSIYDGSGSTNENSNYGDRIESDWILGCLEYGSGDVVIGGYGFKGMIGRVCIEDEWAEAWWEWDEDDDGTDLYCLGRVRVLGVPLLRYKALWQKDSYSYTGYDKWDDGSGYTAYYMQANGSSTYYFNTHTTYSPDEVVSQSVSRGLFYDTNGIGYNYKSDVYRSSHSNAYGRYTTGISYSSGSSYNYASIYVDFDAVLANNWIDKIEGIRIAVVAGTILTTRSMIKAILSNVSEILNTTSNMYVDVSDSSAPNSVYAYWYNSGTIVLPRYTTLKLYTTADKITLPSSSNGIFKDLTNVTSIDLSNFNTSNVTGMSSMFSGCSSLTSLDLGSFDTSKVTNYGWMFMGCSKLTSLDLSVFDTSSAENYEHMFQGCSSLESVNVDGFVSGYMNGGNGGACEAMFANCYSLKSLDLSTWRLSWIDSGSDAAEIFENCLSLNTIVMPKDLPGGGVTEIDLPGTFIKSDDYGSFDGSGNNSSIDTYLNRNFYSHTSSTGSPKTIIRFAMLAKNWQNIMINTGNGGSTFKTDVERIIVSVGEDLGINEDDYVDVGDASTENEIEGVYWEIYGIKTMVFYVRAASKIWLPADSSFIFANLTNCISILDEENAALIDGSLATDMSYMFYNCSRLPYIYLYGRGSTFGSAATSMSYMFSNCRSLASFPMPINSTFGSSATDMSCMFDGCTSLEVFVAGSTFGSSATNMSHMFTNCTGLSSFTIRSGSTFGSSATNMSHMFTNCTGLGSFTIPSDSEFGCIVQDISSMFSGCSNLEAFIVNSSVFCGDNEVLENVSYMFNNCSSLVSVDLHTMNLFGVSDAGDVKSMLGSCRALREIRTPKSLNPNYKPILPYNSQAGDILFFRKDGQGGKYASNVALPDYGSIDLGRGYNLTLNANGGTFNNGTTIMDAYGVYGSPYLRLTDGSLLDDSVFSSSYEFTGWFTNQECTVMVAGADGVIVDDEVEGWTESRDSTVFANATLNPIPVLYSDAKPRDVAITLAQSNATTNATVNKIHYLYMVDTYYEGATGSVVLNDYLRIVPKRENYSFMGYYTEPDGEGDKLIDFNGMPLDLCNIITENKTLYPCWLEPILANDWYSKVENADLGVTSKSSIKSIQTFVGDYTRTGGIDLSDLSVKGTVYATFDADDKVLSIYTTSNLIYLPIDCNGIFSDLSEIEYLHTENFNSSKVTTMANMFARCGKLKELDLTNFGTEKVTTMYRMFESCATIKTLDLSSFVTSITTNLVQMFMNCSELVTLNLSQFEIKSNAEVAGIFSGCTQIKEFVTPNVNEVNIDLSSSSGSCYNQTDKDDKTAYGSFPKGENVSKSIGKIYGVILDFDNETYNTYTVYAVYNSQFIRKANGTALVDSNIYPAYPGYGFEGWVTEEKGVIVVVNPTGTLNIDVEGWTNENAKWIRTVESTLYARWATVDATSIDLYVNNIKVNTIYQWKDHGFFEDEYCQTPVNSVAVPTKEGYTFSAYRVYSNTSVSVYVDLTDSNGMIISTPDIDKYWLNNGGAKAIFEANTDTEYKVYHYVLGVDELYHLQKNETKNGITDSEVLLIDEVDSTLLVENGIVFQEGKVSNEVVLKATINGDGSTEILLYYTRVKHKLTISPNGGKYNDVASDTVIEQYYESTYTLSIPVKEGYTFNSWSGIITGTINVNEDPIQYIYTFGNADDLITANWDENEDTEFKVYHYLNDIRSNRYSLSDNSPQTLHGRTNDLITLSSYALEIEGFTYLAGYLSGSDIKPTTDSIQITSILPDGSRVIYLYYSRNSFAVTLSRGTGIESVSVSNGSSTSGASGTYYYQELVSITAEVKYGYDWLNWTGTYETESQTFEFNMPNFAVTNTANGRIKTYEYTINFKGAGYTNETVPVIGISALNGSIVISSETGVSVGKLLSNSLSYNGTVGESDGTNSTKIRKEYMEIGGITVTISLAGYYLGVSADLTTESDFEELVLNWNAKSSGEINVYAYQRYTITYDKNEGTGNLPTNPQYKIFDTSVNLGNNTLSRYGYTPNGWRTSLNDDAILYSNGYSYENNCDLSLFANWNLNNYTITYVKGSATIDPTNESMQYTYEDDITLPTISQTGYYEFKWKVTEKDANGNWVLNYQFESGEEISAHSYYGDVVLTAVSLPEMYNVIFDMNSSSYPTMSGEIDPGTTIFSVTYNDSVSDVDTVPTLEGWTFIGYYLDADKDSERVVFNDDGEPVQDLDDYISNGIWVMDCGENNDSITLYAHWVANNMPYTVEHYKEVVSGGEYERVDADTQTIYQLTGDTVRAIPKQYDGFTYDETIEGTIDSGVVTADGLLTLKLYYSRNKYNLTIQPNNGIYDDSTDVVVVTQYYESQYEMCSITREGYTFIGWSGLTNGSITKPADTFIYTFGLGDDILTALWKNNRYRVNLLNNFPAKVNIEDEVQTAGTEYYYAEYDTNNKYSIIDADDTFELLLPSIKVDNVDVYTFLGWFTDESDGMLVINSDGEYVSQFIDGYLQNGLWSSTEDKTLYAHWSVNSFELVFDKNTGDTVSPEKKIINYGSKYGELAVATKDGYTFAGWYTQINDGRQVTSNDIMMTIGARIFAHWLSNDVYITVKVNDEIYVSQNIKVKLGVDGQECFVNEEGIAQFTTVAYGEYAIYCSVSDSYKDNLVLSSVNINVVDELTSAVINYYTVSLIEGVGTNLVVNSQSIDSLEVLNGYNILESTRLCALASAQNGYGSLSLIAYNSETESETVNIDNNLIVMPNFELTIESSAVAIEYTISYDSDGGDSVLPQAYFVTTDLTISDEISKTGYIFMGWKLENAVNNWEAKIYQANENIGTGKFGDITLVAQWVGINYTVAYWDGGEAPVSTSSHIYGTYSNLRTIQELEIVREGFDFYGWTYSNVDGESETYEKVFDDGESVDKLTTILNSTINIYAVWCRGANFYSGLNKSSTVATTQYFNDNVYSKFYVEIPEDITEIDNWEMIGWRDDRIAGEVQYSISGVICNNSNSYEFYAIYNRNAQFISGIAQSNIDVATQYYNTADEYNLTTLLPVKINGWEELGWRDDLEASEKLYSVQTRITSSSGIYYAVYKRTLIMEYDGNGSTSGETASHTGTQRYNSYSTITIVNFVAQENGFEKTAYTFVDWMFNEIGGEEIIENGTKAVCPAVDSDQVSFTMYAKWVPTAYVITFDVDGGESITSMNYSIESTDALPSDSRNGYDFVNWVVSVADGNWSLNEEIDAGTNVEGRYGNVTLKAIWDPIKYTITYVQNNGEEDLTQEYYIISEDLKLYGAPNKNGYTFAGWLLGNDTDNWEARIYIADETIGAGKYGDITLEAQWTPNTYNIYFNVDGGTEIESMQYTVSKIEQEIELLETNKRGYSFDGYEITENTITESRLVNKMILIIPAESYGDITLKVIWQNGIVNYSVYHYVMGTDGLYPSEVQAAVKTARTNDVITLQDEIDTNRLVDGGIVFNYASTIKNGEAKTTTVILPDSSTEIHIYYKRMSYNVVLVNGEGITKSTGSGEYFYNQDVAIDAEVENGYTWKSWSGTYNSNSKEYNFKMPANSVELTAQTTINSYTLKINYIINGGEIAAPQYVYSYNYKSQYNVSSPEVNGYSPNIDVVSGTMPARDEEITIIYNLVSYTIIYDVDGGVELQSAVYTIVSDYVLPKTTRVGYTFNLWEVESPNGNWNENARFSAGRSVKGKYGNITLKAVWFANSNTPYTVEHYKQNLALNGYDLVEADTENLVGVTDAEISVTAKNYLGFSLDEDNTNAVLSGNIFGDGSLVLKAYYKRNINDVNLFVCLEGEKDNNQHYLEDECEFGEIGFDDTLIDVFGLSKQYAYGQNVKISAKAKSGYEFIGWYDNKGILISKDETLTFAMDNKAVNYTAKFRVARVSPVVPILIISFATVAVVAVTLLLVKKFRHKKPKTPKPAKIPKEKPPKPEKIKKVKPEKVKKIKPEKIKKPKLEKVKTSKNDKPGKIERPSSSSVRRVSLKDLNLK